MDNKENEIIFECYIEEEEENKDAIEWIKIKQKDDNSILLKIPYSPLFNIKTYQDAIYKHYITNSVNDVIDQSIKILYNNIEIYCSKIFLNKIKEYIDKDKILINIHYNKEKCSFTKLYFIMYLTKYGLFWHESNKVNTLTLSINKEEIIKMI